MISKQKCPICESKDTIVIFSLSAKEAGQKIIPENRNKSFEISQQIENLWHNPKCEVIKCNNCDYSFAWPYIAGNAEIYSTLYYKKFKYPVEKWEYRKAINILTTSEISANANILEIGAGNGSFLDIVSTIITNKDNIHSTEYSSAGVEAILKKGYHCYNTDITALEQKTIPKFDVICMFQVLEHMNKLDEVFKNLNSLSNSAATLIIAVPNGFLRGFYDKLGLHYDIPPIHVGRFTNKTFQFLGKKYGWNVKQITIEPQSYLFKLKKFIFDRFSRLTLTRKTESTKVLIVKLFLRYNILAWLLIRHIRVAILFLSPNTGTSLLVHFEKLADNK